MSTVTSRVGVVVPVVLFVTLSVALFARATTSARAGVGQPSSGDARIMPSYTDAGDLRLPDDYREWVFVGSSLGLSYTEGAGGSDMFHHTLMEPTAYRHFVETGEFREGSMFVLMLHDTGEGVLPSRRGRFADETLGVEMAVKDSTRVGDGWAYYNFGGMRGIREAVAPMPTSACHACHVEHGATDNVFTQFYPLLTDAAGVVAVTSAATGTRPGATPAVTESVAQHATLVLGGLDPVLLTEGREELGKPEIVATHDGRLYHFVSEPTRARFVADTDRFAVQNDTCLVVPGAAVVASLFAVHDGLIYLFADPGCVASFTADPDRYIEP